MRGKKLIDHLTMRLQELEETARLQQVEADQHRHQPMTRLTILQGLALTKGQITGIKYALALMESDR